MSGSFHISRPLLASLTLHAVRDYPQECCGLLIGREVDAGSHLIRIIPALNITAGDPRTTYQIDWQTLFETTRAVRNTPERIIGFYHSHTNGSATPSRSDLASAWIGYTYLILARDPQQRWSASPWCVPHAGARFFAQVMHVEDTRPSTAP